MTGPLDLLFLDGDHTFEGVAQDFTMWGPLVRKGGLIAFHDTVLNGTRDEPGIRKFVEELKRTWRWLSIEFFDPDGAGITAFRDAT
jgi:predicted O-methyltransferase YrrM